MRQAFTLIELLVVISIISLLASVVLSSFNTTKAKARDTERMTELREMQKAVEMYFAQQGSYPNTSSSWRGGAVGCYGGHGYGASGFIPGVVPNYISILPEDPRPNGGNCYLYRSNGVDYKILAHQTIETFDSCNTSLSRGPSYCQSTSIAVYSSGAASW